MRAHPIIDLSLWLVSDACAGIGSGNGDRFQATLLWGYTGTDWLPAIIDGITTIGWLAALAYLAWFVVGQVPVLQDKCHYACIRNIALSIAGTLHGHATLWSELAGIPYISFASTHTFQASVRHTDMDSHYIVVSPDSSEKSGSTRR